MDKLMVIVNNVKEVEVIADYYINQKGMSWLSGSKELVKNPYYGFPCVIKINDKKLCFKKINCNESESYFNNVMNKILHLMIKVSSVKNVKMAVRATNKLINAIETMKMTDKQIQSLIELNNHCYIKNEYNEKELRVKIIGANIECDLSMNYSQLGQLLKPQLLLAYEELYNNQEVTNTNSNKEVKGERKSMKTNLIFTEVQENRIEKVMELQRGNIIKAESGNLFLITCLTEDKSPLGIMIGSDTKLTKLTNPEYETGIEFIDKDQSELDFVGVRKVTTIEEAKLAQSKSTGKIYILTKCKLYKEGVELPQTQIKGISFDNGLMRDIQEELENDNVVLYTFDSVNVVDIF